MTKQEQLFKLFVATFERFLTLPKKSKDESAITQEKAIPLGIEYLIKKVSEIYSESQPVKAPTTPVSSPNLPIEIINQVKEEISEGKFFPFFHFRSRNFGSHIWSAWRTSMKESGRNISVSCKVSPSTKDFHYDAVWIDDSNGRFQDVSGHFRNSKGILSLPGKGNEALLSSVKSRFLDIPKSVKEEVLVNETNS